MRTNFTRRGFLVAGPPALVVASSLMRVRAPVWTGPAMSRIDIATLDTESITIHVEMMKMAARGGDDKFLSRTRRVYGDGTFSKWTEWS